MGSFIESVHQTGNYYTPIVRYKPEIQELMKESNKLEKYQESIKHNGVYSRINILNTFKYHISPSFPSVSSYIDESIMGETLGAYCSTGDYEGEPHKFVGEGKKRKCIKCNMSISALIPSIIFKEMDNTYFFRLQYSAREMDETAIETNRDKKFIYRLILTNGL